MRSSVVYMFLPTFACVGAQRCGTTWLYDCLAQHPGVFLADSKDLSYFRRWNGRPSLYDEQGLDLYEQFFSDAASYSVRGDVSAALFGGEGSAQAMHAAIPDCRL